MNAREPRRMTTSRRKIEVCEESQHMDREAIALLAGEPITAESLAAAYLEILNSRPVARSQAPERHNTLRRLPQRRSPSLCAKWRHFPTVPARPARINTSTSTSSPSEYFRFQRKILNKHYYRNKNTHNLIDV